MNRITKRDILVGLVVVAVGSVCTASLLTMSPGELGGLFGGATGCECDCKDVNNTWHECRHTRMEDPLDTCSLTDCLSNLIYWPQCTENESKDSCPWEYNANAICGIQDRKNKAPDDCDGIAQGVVTFKPATICSADSHDGRCLIPTCGGGIVYTNVVRGRTECK